MPASTHERQFYNRSGNIIDFHYRSRREKFIPDVTQCDRVFELWRICRGRNASDLFALCGCDRLADFNWLIHPQAGQPLSNVPAVFDANDDLLAQVTAFRVTDRVVEVRFEHDIRFVHVLAMTWNARLDSQHFKNVGTYGLRARSNQFLSH